MGSSLNYGMTFSSSFDHPIVAMECPDLETPPTLCSRSKAAGFEERYWLWFKVAKQVGQGSFPSREGKNDEVQLLAHCSFKQKRARAFEPESVLDSGQAEPTNIVLFFELTYFMSSPLRVSIILSRRSQHVSLEASFASCTTLC